MKPDPVGDTAEEMAVRAKTSWTIDYPQNCISYVEAFRRHYWDHAGVCRLLDDLFRKDGSVTTICELGSGAGTNMLMLADFGYRCTGYDVNDESVALSRERSAHKEGEIDFLHLDFTQGLPTERFDAVLSLFVPIALKDMTLLAHRAAELVRPGGYFACMLLVLEPHFKDRQREQKNSTEYLEVDGKHVLRFNFYQKAGHQIDYQGVYLIGDSEGCSMARDIDTYDLLDPDQHLDISADLYRFVKRERIYGKAGQCPPMTFEVLDIYQRI